MPNDGKGTLGRRDEAKGLSFLDEPGHLPLLPAGGTPPITIDDIPGWFRQTDRRLMSFVLAHQRATGMRGNLVELGVYLGKSAVLIGQHRGDDEVFVVCDLFDSLAPDERNADEVRRSYKGLSRATFERNYFAFHRSLPTIVEAPTSEINLHVDASSCRFVHVDASHRYEHVRVDIASSHRMLVPDGIVTFDDYRSAHTPGVAAAVWEAILTTGLRPVFLSPSKLYATWGDPRPMQTALIEWLRRQPDATYAIEEIAEHQLVLVSDGKKKPATAPQPQPPAPAPPPPQNRGTAHPTLVDLLPPIVTRALRRLRAALRSRHS